jgi:hypothetical protein
MASSISEILDVMILETTLQNWNQPSKNRKIVCYVHTLIPSLLSFSSKGMYNTLFMINTGSLDISVSTMTRLMAG